MALSPMGFLTNIHRSLDAYLRAAIIDDMGLSFQGHGVRRFVPPPDAAWVSVDYSLLTMQKIFQRQMGGEYIGSEVVGPINLYLYRQARVFTTDYTILLAAVRDTLLGYFPESGLIPIYDYTQVSGTPPSTPPRVAAMLIDNIGEQLLDRGEESGLVCWEIRPTLRYEEEYTRHE